MKALKCFGLAILVTMVAAIGFAAFSLIAYAQAPVDPGAVVISNADFLQDLLNSLGGLKGASMLGIAGLLCQLAMQALQAPAILGNAAGKFKLIAIYGLSLVIGVISLKISGVSLAAALLHSNTLAAVQVLAHQALKQFGVIDS